MLINIRGTSGSGKTTVVRAIMERFGPPEPILDEKGKKHLGYYLHKANLQVIGDYRNVCGGCDTISDYRVVLEQLLAANDAGRHALFEGLLVTSYSLVRWAEWVNDGIDYRAVTLSTPLDVCIERIKRRREERCQTKPLNTQNTENKYITELRSPEKLRRLGVPHVYVVSVDEAIVLVSEWLQRCE